MVCPFFKCSLRSLPNSLLIYSRAAKGTFRFFLDTGCAPPFTLSLPFNLEHFPRPPEKNLGKSLFEFLFEICRIGRCIFYFATKCIHLAIPRFESFYPICSEQVVRIFYYVGFQLLVTPFSITVRITSPKMLIFRASYGFCCFIRL